VPEGVVSRLDAEEPWGERPPHGIGRTVVGAASAIGAGIEVEHVLPGEVFEGFHSERLHLVEMFVADAPAHRFQRAPIQFCEIDVEERGLYVELNTERTIAEQEIERDFV
jgi:hypothetical protein